MNRIAATCRVLFPVVLSIIPGFGHIWVRRYNRGLALFLIFFGTWNLTPIHYLLADDGEYEGLLKLSHAAVVGIIVFAFVDIIRITVWLKSSKVINRRKSLYRRSMVHFLRSEYGQAEDAASRMIRTDPLDTSALFVLGMIQREGGEFRKALRSFYRAQRSTTEDYWKFDLKREIKATKARHKREKQ